MLPRYIGCKFSVVEIQDMPRAEILEQTLFDWDEVWLEFRRFKGLRTCVVVRTTWPWASGKTKNGEIYYTASEILGG
jgi:hypothetical protein